MFTASATRGRRRFLPRRTLIRSRRVQDLTEDEATRIRQAVEDWRRGGRRSAQGRLHEHQATDGNPVLSRAASSPRPADARPADAHQRAHPQGPAQGHGHQPEESDENLMAKPEQQPGQRQGRQEQEVQEARTQECSARAGLRSGVVQQHHRDHHGHGGQHAQLEESSGSLGFRGSRKGTPFAAQQAAVTAANLAREHGLRSRWMSASPGRVQVANQQSARWLRPALKCAPSATLRRFRTTAAVRRSVAAYSCGVGTSK
jgi:hypothetical protein